MITLCEPSISDLIEKLEHTIRLVKSGKRMNPIEMHENIKKMYNWRDVARRTQIVYNQVTEYKPSNDLLDILNRFDLT